MKIMKTEFAMRHYGINTSLEPWQLATHTRTHKHTNKKKIKHIHIWHKLLLERALFRKTCPTIGNLLGRGNVRMLKHLPD